MDRKFILSAAAIGVLTWASAANATQILDEAQTSGSNTITATANGAGTSTTITGTNIAVGISQILGGSATTGFLDLSATSVGTASLVAGNVIQDFSGSFSITSLSGGGGTNFLSGTFTDAVFGANGSPSLTLSAGDPPDSITFTSSVIPAADLGNPSAISLSFSNVTPGVGIDNTTLASMTASETGTFSATAVPEPTSLVLFGSAMIGLGAIRRRRKQKA